MELGQSYGFSADVNKPGLLPQAFRLEDEGLPVERRRWVRSQDWRDWSDRLMEVREEERRRISRELHDELGQQLSALKMALGQLLQPQARRVNWVCHKSPYNFNDAQADMLAGLERRVAYAQSLLDGLVAATRRIAADLRPPMLDDLGLSEALGWLCREVQKRTGLQIDLQVVGLESGLDEPYTTALYRMVQESLTNIERHAQATQAWVELACTDEAVVLRVRDNGKGMDLGATQKNGCHGLVGLSERARMLGGTLELENHPPAGCCVSVRLPYGRCVAP
jgi:signal transduction histidine kinase